MVDLAQAIALSTWWWYFLKTCLQEHAIFSKWEIQELDYMPSKKYQSQELDFKYYCSEEDKSGEFLRK